MGENIESKKNNQLESSLQKSILRQYSTEHKPNTITTNDNNNLIAIHKEARHDVVRRLLTHVVRAELTKVVELLEKNPELLLESGKVEDYSGRMVEGTAYRLALAAEDFEMCNKLKVFFSKLNNGEEERKKQFDAQFPSGIENNPKNYNFNSIVDAITKDPAKDALPNAATEAVLKKFRDDFTPKPEDIITTGKHFDIKPLMRALEIYDFNSVKNEIDDSNSEKKIWGSNQCYLFWRQVIGHLQRFVPACYAQAICQGLYNVVLAKQTLKRTLMLAGGNIYYPLNSDKTYILGRDYAIYSYGSYLCKNGGSARLEVESTDVPIFLLKLLCNVNTAELNALNTHFHPNIPPLALPYNAAELEVQRKHLFGEAEETFRKHNEQAMQNHNNRSQMRPRRKGWCGF